MNSPNAGDQQQAREIDGQHVHREEREHKSDGAEHARREHAGMREFRVEPEDADNQKDEKDVWLHDAREEFFARGHFARDDDRMRESELRLGAVEARDGAAVELREQIFGRGGDEIDELAVERFFFAEGFGVGDGGGGEFGVASALADVAAQVGGGIVDDFFAQRVVNLHGLAADFHDRRSGAGFRAGRHGGDIRGKQNEKSGGSGARAGGYT